ncbi:MAG: hypothetical protein EHM64_14240 [Ignavibacteriae bacterium]|nr:MAG: hypothetical protein EHM64_14240 [Ignavibacteriota bacterium]
MNNGTIYQDSLIELFRDKIVFKKYYFPSLKSKEVPVESIEKVVTKEPSLGTGKYRFHGTGDFRTWYPQDFARNKRDKIFILFIKNKWVRIGFTGENSGSIEKYFEAKRLLRTEQ